MCECEERVKVKAKGTMMMTAHIPRESHGKRHERHGGHAARPEWVHKRAVDVVEQVQTEQHGVEG